ncbi:unnamed protein product [Clonostachys rosea]|uniref:Uncharacterized protein n=1 Tax=Bionectria ochroleuca TaxID=29856 RepID=A0ABY6V2X0_BIOOC|nr:unnamed protein product [Clonostachys rosea]
MVAITRTAAAGIAILSALNGAAASTETRDVFDDIAALDARDILNEGGEPLALDARDFDDELDTRDFDDDLEKRFFLTKLAGKAIGAIAGRRHRRSLDDTEDFLDTRDIEEDVVAFDTRDLPEDFPLEARAILDGSHPDLVVVNKRFLKKAFGFAKKLLFRSLDDDEAGLEARDLDDAAVTFDTRDLGDDVPLEARAILEGSHPDVVVVNKRFLKKAFGFAKKLLFRSIDDDYDLEARDFDDYDIEVRDFDDYDLEVRDFDDYDLEVREEEESSTESPSGGDDAPVSKSRKGKGKGLKGLKGLKKGKGLKGLKKSALRKGKFGKKAGKKGKKFGKKGPKSGKKAHKKARKSKKGTRSVDGGQFYEA